MNIMGPIIYLDCDGVLADFDAYAEKVFGMHPRKFEETVGSKEFWKTIHTHEDFFEKLPLHKDAMTLFDAVSHLHPIILTGCPRGGWAEEQKCRWAAKHFPNTEIICCMSADKAKYCNQGDVIIDDWPKHRSKWIAAGGIWISHYDAVTSLDTLWAHYPNLKGI